MHKALYTCLPLLSLRLVRESEFTYDDLPKVSSPEAVRDVVLPLVKDLPYEICLALLLNTNARVVGIFKISEGGLDATVVDRRKVVQAALLANASSVILAHNHPSGNPCVSRGDVRITKEVAEACEVLGIKLHDHVIVTPDGACTSMFNEGYL
jgi:DNA repair protein RadC